jgi:dTDP-glucose 4,6-dehydratase
MTENDVSSENKNVLITGAFGFIGSFYAKLLVREGYDVSILDKLTYAADMGRIEDIKNNVNLYTGDICNVQLCDEIVKKHDINIIVNMAASTHVDSSIEDSREFVKSNFEGVQVLLDICRENDIEKYVQI